MKSKRRWWFNHNQCAKFLRSIGMKNDHRIYWLSEVLSFFRVQRIKRRWSKT